MPQSLSKVYVHLIFSTKYRQNFIDHDIESCLWAYISGSCNALGCIAIRVGGYLNHIHVLCALGRTVSQADLVEEIKRSSSKWMKTQGEQYKDFYWQNGYGIFSVNPTQIDNVINYIVNQREHHEKMTFEQEYVGFLKKYHVDFDDKYVWD